MTTGDSHNGSNSQHRLSDQVSAYALKSTCVGAPSRSDNHPSNVRPKGAPATPLTSLRATSAELTSTTRGTSTSNTLIRMGTPPFGSWPRSLRGGNASKSKGGQLRLLALRQLGRFLIRNGRGRGRPAKTPSADVLPTLACLGISDRHISADAKIVARITQADFDAYLAQETEPTLKGLLRFASTPKSFNLIRKWGWEHLVTRCRGRSAFDIDETSTTEWFTPPEIFKAMETEFDLDVCSPGAEIVPWILAAQHLTRADNGLRPIGTALCGSIPRMASETAFGMDRKVR